MSNNYVWAALVQALPWREKICKVSSVWTTARKYVADLYVKILLEEKMNKKQKLLTVIMGLILLVFAGSSCVQNLVIPAYVSEDAAAWAGVPRKLINPLYPTLADAKRLKLAINFKIALERIKAGHYVNITNLSIIAGEEIKQIAFDPSGPMGLLVSGLGFGTIGTVLGGAYKQRPKDKKKIEELEKANGTKQNTHS